MGTTLKFFRRTKMAASPSENRPEMNELHPAPQSSSHLESMEAYKAMYEESISDPEAFWGELANSYITWHRPFNKVLHGGFNDGDVAWFSGGELNVSENCLDRHLDERGDKVAIPHEVKGQAIFVYVVLHSGFSPSDDLRHEIRDAVKEGIGSFAKPTASDIVFITGIPVTRSGKSVRRILRLIATGEEERMGDVSTLANPAVVEEIIAAVKDQRS